MAYLIVQLFTTGETLGSFCVHSFWVVPRLSLSKKFSLSYVPFVRASDREGRKKYRLQKNTQGFSDPYSDIYVAVDRSRTLHDRLLERHTGTFAAGVKARSNRKDLSKLPLRSRVHIFIVFLFSPSFVRVSRHAHGRSFLISRTLFSQSHMYKSQIYNQKSKGPQTICGLPHVA